MREKTGKQENKDVNKPEDKKEFKESKPYPLSEAIRDIIKNEGPDPLVTKDGTRPLLKALKSSKIEDLKKIIKDTQKDERRKERR